MVYFLIFVPFALEWILLDIGLLICRVRRPDKRTLISWAVFITFLLYVVASVVMVGHATSSNTYRVCSIDYCHEGTYTEAVFNQFAGLWFISVLFVGSPYIVIGAFVLVLLLFAFKAPETPTPALEHDVRYGRYIAWAAYGFVGLIAVFMLVTCFGNLFLMERYNHPPAATTTITTIPTWLRDK